MALRIGERVGRRRAMLIGAAVATVGFAATAFSINLYDLLLWRAFRGVRPPEERVARVS